MQCLKYSTTLQEEPTRVLDTLVGSILALHPWERGIACDSLGRGTESAEVGVWCTGSAESLFG